MNFLNFLTSNASSTSLTIVVLKFNLQDSTKESLRENTVLVQPSQSTDLTPFSHPFLLEKET